MNSITRSKAGAVRTVLGAAIAVLLLLQTTGFALAAGITGTISGTLTNAATGAALSGVKVSAASPAILGMKSGVQPCIGCGFQAG